MIQLRQKPPGGRQKIVDKPRFPILLYVVTLSTVTVFPFTFDAFTTSKLLVLSVGLSLISIIGIAAKYSLFSVKSSFASLLLIGFVFSLTVSTVVSEVPITRALIGQFGRGNGLIYYIICALIMFLSSNWFRKSDAHKLDKTLILLAWALCFYSALQKIGIDFAVLETRGLSSVVLTFGNSNFAGSMLAVLFAYHFCSGIVQLRWNAGRVLLLIAILMSSTFPNALQGYLVIAFSILAGITALLTSGIRSRFSRLAIVAFWVMSIFLVLLGLVGKGVFSSIFAVNTFRIRIEYWKIALKVIREDPWFGVGPDKLYDYSARYMAPESVDLISLTRLDNAHNWFLNIGANYGLIVLFFLVCLVLLICKYSVTMIFKYSKVNPSGTSCAVSFLSTLLVGLVSIEQPGIGVWTYLFGGLVIASHREAVASVEGVREVTFRHNPLQDKFIVTSTWIVTSILIFFSCVLFQRVFLDFQLRANLKMLVVGEETTDTILDITRLSTRLGSEPEYAVQALGALAQIGAVNEIDAISKSTFDYDVNSIQANLIRAEVLRALNRSLESCPIRARLIRNMPWDFNQLKSYLICISNGYRDSESRAVLTLASKFFKDVDDSSIGLEKINVPEFESRITHVSTLARLNHELGRSEQAQEFALFALQLLDDLNEVARANPEIVLSIDLVEVRRLIDFFDS